MKLRNNKRKNLTVIGIVVAAIVVIALLIGAITLVVRLVKNNQSNEIENGDEITKIQVSIKPKTTYYVGQGFDPTGIQVQVITKEFKYSYMVDYSKLEFSGFDSSTVTDKLTITVSYQGFTTSYDIQVKEAEKPSPKLQSIEVYDFTTTYDLTEWNKYGPNVVGAKIRCFYNDGSIKEDIYLQNSHINGYTKLNSAGKTEITVKYSDGVTTVETTVTITVTN